MDAAQRTVSTNNYEVIGGRVLRLGLLLDNVVIGKTGNNTRAALGNSPTTKGAVGCGNTPLT